MRRYKEPAFAVACIALLASLCVHLPIYGALGVLSVLSRAPIGRPPSSEDDLVWVDIDSSDDTPPTETPTPEDTDDEDRRPREREPVARPRPVPLAEVEPPPQPPEPVAPVPEPEPPAVPPPPETVQNLQSVEQTTDTPAEEAPEDAQFLAEQNNRVEEETVAELRNMQEDQRDPQAAASEQPETEAPADDGTDSQETRSADLREVEGSDARHPTVAEARQSPPRTPTDATPAASRLPNAPRRGETAESTPGGTGRSGERQPNVAASTPAPRTETLTIDDGAGTFTVERVVPEEDEGTAQRRLLMAHGGTDDDRRGRTRGDGGGRTRGDGDGRPAGSPEARGRTGPNLRVGFSRYEQIMGEDVLREEREARFAEQRSQRAGQSHAQRWQQFRAAIENFTPSVRPGNQTALNTRASPFAAYLAAVHRRIHREFADEFLANRSRFGAVPAATGDLHAILEIVFNPDGTLHRVGVARTSGVITFDHGAYAAVLDGQPYPSPPATIRSGDGRVYVHWGFHSNELACGTFNAQPYILPSPPDTEPTILDPTRPPERTAGARGAEDDAPADDPNTPQDESDGT